MQKQVGFGQAKVVVISVAEDFAIQAKVMRLGFILMVAVFVAEGFAKEVEDQMARLILVEAVKFVVKDPITKVDYLQLGLIEVLVVPMGVVTDQLEQVIAQQQELELELVAANFEAKAVANYCMDPTYRMVYFKVEVPKQARLTNKQL